MQIKDDSYGFTALPGVELPRLEAHFARKKEGGVYDFVKLSAGRSRGHGPGTGRGRGLVPRVPRARIMSMARASVVDSDAEDEEFYDAEETEEPAIKSPFGGLEPWIGVHVGRPGESLGGLQPWGGVHVDGPGQLGG